MAILTSEGSCCCCLAAVVCVVCQVRFAPLLLLAAFVLCVWCQRTRSHFYPAFSFGKESGHKYRLVTMIQKEALGFYSVSHILQENTIFTGTH